MQDTIVIDGVEYVRKDSLDKVKKNDEGIEEIAKKVWASNGIYVGDDDNVDHYTIDLDADKVDDRNHQATIGLNFQTEKKAQKFLDKLKALKAVWKWKTEFDYGGGDVSEGEGWFVAYCYHDNKLDSDSCDKRLNTGFMPIYSSSDKAEEAIKELESEYKTLFDIV